MIHKFSLLLSCVANCYSNNDHVLWLQARAGKEDDIYPADCVAVAVKDQKKKKLTTSAWPKAPVFLQHGELIRVHE